MSDAAVRSSRIDLLLARNTLMYFDARTQTKTLSDFHFSLDEGGFLFLGKPEVLMSRSSLFTPVHLKHRVFAKNPDRTAQRPRFVTTPAQRLEPERPVTELRVREAGFESVPVAQLVVDPAGRLALANEYARRLFGLVPEDVGRPLQDLQVSYRPLELRSQIDTVMASLQPVSVADVEWPVDGELHTFDVHLAPLAAAGGPHLGMAISFTDVTRYRELRDVLQASKERLETAYEELQSTTEELETTNEELESTNEELETMNEELQSTNEELQAMNNELRLVTDDLNDANAFLESVLGSLRAGVAAVDEQLVVVAWNEHAAELWGLRGDDVRGQHLLSLDVGLPLVQVGPLVKRCLAEGAAHELELEAVNRRGQRLLCLVRCSTLLRAGGETRGVILQMEEREPPRP